LFLGGAALQRCGKSFALLRLQALRSESLSANAAYNSTYIEELAQRVHPRDGKKECCMIEAYMDESGIHDGAHVCVIAGYWGTVKKWKKFEDRWKTILHDANEPTLVWPFQVAIPESIS
jgi:hypothetical protein